MRHWIGIGVMVLAAAAAGCTRAGTGSGDSSGVAARVNGKAISQVEVENYFKLRTQGSPDKPAGDAANILRLEIVRQLIETEIMTQKADELHLKAADSEIDAEIKNLKGDATDADFKKTLEARGVSDLDLRHEIGDNIVMQKVVENQVTSKINVTDAEITKFFEANKEAFNAKEPMFRMAVIAVSSDPSVQINNLRNDKALNEEQAVRKIQMIETQARAGEDFQQLASEYSEDPQTAQQGGDLGYQPASMLERFGASFKDTVLKMKPGDMTPIIRTDNSYWLFKLLGRREPGQHDLSSPDVKESIKEELQSQKQQLLTAAFSEKLHDDAKVENFLADEIVASFQGKK